MAATLVGNVLIISGTAAPEVIDQWVTITPRAPARKNARVRPDRLSPVLALGPAVLHAERTIRSASSLSFSISAGLRRPELAFGAFAGTETTIDGPGWHLRSSGNSAWVASTTIRRWSRSGFSSRALVKLSPSTMAVGPTPRRWPIAV